MFRLPFFCSPRSENKINEHEYENDRNSLLQLDRICTEFENRWELSHGPEAIGEIIQQHNLDSRVAIELATIDLERQWRAFSSKLEKLLRSNPVHNAENLRQKIPGWREYCDQLEFRQDLVSELQMVEWSVRQRFGDAPSRDCFPDIGSEKVESTLLMVEVFSANKRSLLRAQLPSSIEVGRQTKGEPHAVSIAKSRPTRIVLVDALDTTVSRTQAKISIFAERVLKVENVSDNRSFALISKHSVDEPSAVEPGKFQLTLSPIKVKFGDLTIQLERLQPMS